MRSDNWNILSKLLGTPAPPPEPKPAEPKPVDAKPAEPKVEAPAALTTEAAFGVTISPDADDRRPAKSSVHPQSKESEDDVAASVLRALTAPTPPAILPGFGAPTRSEGESTYERPKHPSDEGSSLDRIIPADARPPRSRDDDRRNEGGRGESRRNEGSRGDRPTRDRERADQDRSRQDRSERGRSEQARSERETERPKKADFGFGSGLVDIFDDSDIHTEAFVEDFFEDDGVDEFDAPVSKPDARKNKDSADNSDQRPRRGRRGRRLGQRQEIDIEDLDNPESPPGRKPVPQSRSESSARSAGDAQERGRRPSRSDSSADEASRGRGRRDAGRDAGRSERSSRREPDRSPRGRSESHFRDESDVDFGFVDDYEDDEIAFAPELDLDAGSDAPPDVASDRPSIDREPRGRGRARRGGRSRRGRDRDEEPSDIKPRVASDLDARIESGSAFDVEDDFEVDEVPNERPHRSRGGRGRGRGRLEANPVDNVPEEGDDDRSSRRPKTRARREAEPVAEMDAADREARTVRRGEIPTWLETVEDLVEANIANHNKNRGGGGGGNRDSGSRGRRR